MAREKSVKVRLNEIEDKFISKESESLSISRSEYIRRLIDREMNDLNKK